MPGHDIHHAFIAWASAQLDERKRAVFDRMAARSGIGHRWSILPMGADGASPVDAGGFYATSPLPGTGERMRLYASAAPDLAMRAIDALAAQAQLGTITHLVVASCTEIGRAHV